MDTIRACDEIRVLDSCYLIAVFIAEGDLESAEKLARIEDEFSRGLKLMRL